MNSIDKSIGLSLDRNRLSLFALLATSARTATGAATVGVLILATDSGLAGQQLGLLAACLTAPHLLGPIWGRWLDTAKDARKLIAMAACLYSVVLFVTAYFFSAIPYWLVIGLLLVCGSSAPFLMGGLSGQLNHLFQDHRQLRRQAQGWDVACYAVGTTMGPLIVAFLAKWFDAQTAVATIAVLPLITAFWVMKLPKHSTGHNTVAPVPSVSEVAQQIIKSGPLSRTLYLTMATSFSLASLPICAVLLVTDWQQDPASAATLVSVYGLGNLLGSLFLIHRPSQSAADPHMTITALCVSLGVLLILLSGSFALGLAAFILSGIANAFFFAATLSARTEYAPPQSASQVFMWIAAMKIAAVSFGSFLAGALAEVSTKLPLLAALTITLTFAFISTMHRRLEHKHIDN